MDKIKEKLQYLPEQPGVYLMYDKNRNIIYVGKAVILKNRIKSYFTSGILDNKTSHLVANINDFEYIITNSEKEAFILEANLIKQHQPKYNIVLKDDKKYPFIKIRNDELYPSIEITRDVIDDGSHYYGPYTDSKLLRTILRDLEWLLPHKTCNKRIVEKNQNKSPLRACINHQMGKCPAPCIYNIDKEDYRKIINKISKYLLGKDDELIKELKVEMETYSTNLQFEKAAKIRDKIIYIEKLSKKQHVYFNDLKDRDIIAYYQEDKHIAVTVLNMRKGKINKKETFSFNNSASETPEAVLRAFCLQFYHNDIISDNLPFQVLIQIKPDDFESLYLLFQKKLIVPERGEYKKLIEICRKNAFDYIEAIKLSHLRKSTRTIFPIQDLKEYLNLKKLPRKIICIDVSTIQGTDTVSSIVYFENGKPLKKQYRHFVIKTVQGQDDYACIAETLNRYLPHIYVDEERMNAFPTKWEMPDLIIIDGGKGHLNVALDVFLEHCENNEELKSIELISLAKRIEEVFLPMQSESIIFPKNSSAVKLITKIRDEAHRFAITHHRKKRNNRLIKSVLDEVKGLGEEKKILLLKEFGCIDNIKNADINDLMKIKGIGLKLAEQILHSFTYLRHV